MLNATQPPPHHGGSPIEPALPPGAPRVRITTGAGSAGQKTWNIRRPVTVIGCERHAQIVLSDESVGKSHCAIINNGRELLLRDLHSQSGTLFKDQAVDLRLLSDGDVLQVGPTSIQVAVTAVRRSDRTSAGMKYADPLVRAEPLILKLAGPGVASRSFTIESTAVVIGRRDGAEVHLDHADVSLAHALIFVLDGQTAVCDLGSRTGTRVNEQAQTLALLKSGDKLSIGPFDLTVQVGREAAAAVAEAVVTPVKEPARLAPVSGPVASAPPTFSPPQPAASAPPAGQTMLVAPRDLDFDTLQHDLQTAWSRWESWHQTLASAAEVLRRRHEELASRATDVERREAEIGPRVIGLNARSEQLAKREQTVAEQERKLKERENSFAALEAASQMKVEQRQAELHKWSESLRGLEAQWGAKHAEIEQRTAALSERTAQLDLRQQTAEQREKRLLEMERLMGQFQNMFTQISPPPIEFDGKSRATLPCTSWSTPAMHTDAAPSVAVPIRKP